MLLKMMRLRIVMMPRKIKTGNERLLTRHKKRLTTSTRSYAKKMTKTSALRLRRILTQLRSNAILLLKKCIRQAGKGGGYICTTSNTVHGAVKPENYVAMVEAIREYGQYPLAL